MRARIPPEKDKDALNFTKKKPEDRLASIRAGFSVHYFTLKFIAHVLTVDFEDSRLW